MQTAPPPDWSPTSWQQKEARQQADYPDEAALQAALRELRSLPPLVTSWEIDALKEQLAEAAYGKRFLLQGGDCAEDFSECNARVIANRLRILLQMSLVLVYGLKTRVVRVGRFAGQYAKPRSSDTETRNGVTLPTYRGDIVNALPFTPEARTPNPQRLLRAYSRSALTLNYVRALAGGGFADLHHPEFWELDFVKHSPLHNEYRSFVDAMTEAVGFIETLSESHLSELEQVQFFTSHEALHLHFEEALTRDVWYGKQTYNLSAHLPWIGMRTAHVDGAHVEYMRGIANPIGIKLGPAMTASWLLDLLNVLDPEDEPGRITLITRFGADQIGDCLPPLLETVRASGRTVLWCSDPMHGNTESTPSGYKTRRFENILAELEQAFDIHAAMGSRLGGVHFELTGENVTECTGGAGGLAEADLKRAYKSQVDPRLNAEQGLEMALRIVGKHRRMNGQT